MRTAHLCELYQDEIKILERTGCSSQLGASLSELTALASIEAENLMALQDKAEEIKAINSAEECRVFETE